MHALWPDHSAWTSCSAAILLDVSDLSLTLASVPSSVFLFAQTTSPSDAFLAVALRRTAPVALAAEVAAEVREADAVEAR